MAIKRDIHHQNNCLSFLSFRNIISITCQIKKNKRDVLNDIMQMHSYRVKLLAGDNNLFSIRDVYLLFCCLTTVTCGLHTSASDVPILNCQISILIVFKFRFLSLCLSASACLFIYLSVFRFPNMFLTIFTPL